MTVTINGVSDSTTLSVQMLATVKASIGLTPNSASPVLKTEITAQLDQGYPFTLLNTDFNATLQGLNDTTYEKPLYVMSVDDA